MAITRAQQAKQMLQDGGMLVQPSKTGKRPGYRGDDAARSSEGTSGGRADPGNSSRGDGPARGGGGGNTNRERGITQQYKGPKGTTGSIKNVKDDGPKEYIGGQEFNLNPTTPEEQERKNFARSLDNDKKRRERRKRALEQQKLFKNISLRNKLMLDPTIRTLDDNLIDVGEIDDQFSTIGKVPIGFAGAFGKAFKVDPSTKYYDEDSIREIAANLSRTQKSGITATQADTLRDIREDIDMRDRILDPNDNVTQSEFDEYINRNKINFPDDDGGPDPILPIIPKVTDDTEEDTTPVRNLGGLSPRIGGSIFDFTGMADGGRAGMMDGGMMSPEGGIMDLETGRQMYFLGKLVKKATRAVKKIAKSPIGKAALLYGGAAMAGSFGAGQGLFSKGMFNPGNIGRGLFGITAKGQAARGFPELAAKKGLFGKLGLTEGYGALMPTMKGGITLASILPLLAGKTEEEKKNILDEYYASQQLTPSQSVRGVGSEMDFYDYNIPLAEGGMPSKEPVAKETMPLLDMDGKEMDLRAEGGFVPIGRMEKADDVPARLSKNEFVFTADAVRNAGDGDVDKGAEVMYNMMKNLESGGDVSEESQGLEGAREMFQTSKRLEEVL